MTSSNKVGRRSVVRGAAWTAPAVVLATAAPSVAASALNIQFVPGSTRGVLMTAYSWYGVQFINASVLNTGSSTIPMGGLSMTVTFSPQTANPYFLAADWAIPGWTRVSASIAPSLSYTNAATLTAGSALTFSNTGGNGTGVYFDSDTSPGTFTLTFAAGSVTQTASFAALIGAPTTRPDVARPPARPRRGVH